MKFCRHALACALSFAVLFTALSAHAQAGGAGRIYGEVTDPSGAVIPNATVTLKNSASGFSQSAVTGTSGKFQITNVPFSAYAISVSAKGFAPLTQTVQVSSAVGNKLDLVLGVAAASSTVTVSAAGPLVQTSSEMETNINRNYFKKVPLESLSSSLSSLVTLTTPGVTADSNGLFHGLGDHASNSFSVDGQPITDQQSKVFSNQLPVNAIQSMQVIEGAPPAQYGDKTDLIIVVTTRSGQGVTKPTGSVYSSYGSFGSGTTGINLSYGGNNWGEFIEADGLDTGRFLDPPEFTVFHSKGNEGNIFDRVDYDFTPATSGHLDLNYTRSWFQTPNAFQNVNVQNVIDNSGESAHPIFGSVGNTDQRSKIDTFNIAPSLTQVISKNAVLNVGLYLRKDDYDYFPSNNPLADLGPPDLQTASISQYRTLTNTGIHVGYTYAKGIQDLLLGGMYEQTILREHDRLGIVENTLNSPCMNPLTGVPLPGYGNQSQCPDGAAGRNPDYQPALAPYDLTRGGTFYHFFGHTDVKEFALYAEDQIKTGKWHFSLGLRQDVYNGLVDANQTEPRLGVAYNIAKTKSVVGFAYARDLETPFNENLVLSSHGCANPVLAPLLFCTAGVSTNMEPGYRNEYHINVQQHLGKDLVFIGEYLWSYTNNAFDFSVLGNTPITFPIDWKKSDIYGFAGDLELPNYHNISLYTVVGSITSRFFPPQVAGAGASVGHTGFPFLIDHDEKLNSTTHVQYTIPGVSRWRGLWAGFNWHFDSGMVAGSTPCYGVTDPNTPCINSSTTLNGQPAIAMVDNNIPATINPVTHAPVALPLTADEEFEAGFACNGVRATPTHALPAVCPANEFSSSQLYIPAPGTGDNNTNPPRVTPHSIFDLSVGMNNIFHRDKYKTSVDLTAVNLANKYALYNYLSTFSGTHFITPRALSARVTVNF